MMRLVVLFWAITFSSSIIAQQDSKVTLKETQEWLIAKIQSNGVATYPANGYKVYFNTDCVITIEEVGFEKNKVSEFSIELKSIDFEKVTYKVNKVGTLIVHIGSHTLRFNAEDNLDFYNRLIKALKYGKKLCGGADDNTF